MSLTTFSGKAGLQQRVFPFYRAPFIDLLAEHCQGGLGFFAGDPRSDELIETGKNLEHASYTHAKNIHSGKGMFFRLRQANIIEWLTQLNPDVLIAEANARYLSTPQAIRWMHNHSRPVIGWGLGSPQTGGVLEFIRDWQRARFLRQFDGLIAYSKKGAEDYIRRGLDPTRVFIAPNAATCAPVFPPPERVYTGKLTILFVGRLQDRKRIDLLLRVCASFEPAQQPDVTIVGDGPQKNALESLAKQIYPRTVFTGLKMGSELETYFKQANLFVLPGTGGLAIQQAMSYALPVIVAEGDGTQSNLVTPANGWQVEPGSEESLRDAIQTAAQMKEKLNQDGVGIVPDCERRDQHRTDGRWIYPGAQPGEADMKIAVIADGRSPITRSWIMGLVGNGHRVDLISSYPCTKPEGVGDFFILSLAFSQVGRPNGSESSLRKNRSGWIQKSRLLLLKLRSTFGPLSLYTVKDRYIEIIKTLQPDLVQALRIPFEGMLASFTPVGIPVVVNSWGNDLTLHAPSSPWMREFTRRSVRRADGFCADCQRDIRLAGEWGLRPNTPTLFAPGNGGLDLGLIRQMKEENAELMVERQQSQVVINPRGIRPAYVRNDVFFQALPAVLKAIPSTKVFCSAMRGQPDAEKYMTKFGLGGQVNYWITSLNRIYGAGMQVAMCWFPRLSMMAPRIRFWRGWLLAASQWRVRSNPFRNGSPMERMGFWSIQTIWIQWQMALSAG